jgi:site-specific recombinase XerD
MESESQVNRVCCTKCGAFVDEVRLKLLGLGYRVKTLSTYGAVWQKLVVFADNEAFSRDLVDRFLSSQGLPQDVLGLPFKSIRSISFGPDVVSAVRILLRCVLERPSEHGGLVPHVLSGNLPVPLEGYALYCTQQRRNQPDTVNARVGEARRFLAFATIHVAPDLGSLRAEHVSAFLKSRLPMSSRGLATVISRLKSFLRYLWETEIIHYDPSRGMPRIRIPEDAHIPNIWTEQEVSAILSAVERRSAKGKRDYAILLLACKLGLRSKDIRELSLENLHWEESRIDIVQSKTGSPLALPLLDEVGEALIDYLYNARPQSPSKKVFLTCKAPIGPIMRSSALSYLMQGYCRRAAITTRAPYRGSIHSFRHTLATRLLRHDTPLHTIANVLGHTSIESVRIYTKVDLRALRSVAINPDCCLSKEGDS